ncbi:hypothetical protein O6H91_10G014000 [Diphasiastrum complanatum]|uniref:Uncharacterized protein n=1 Tax=Diphasiastrum complanatum TaxID=34168 RepID=A0ACC2CEF7_DIPCM|nr:hypothetical protein O6H91_10G014000 [Diphasiastrum complanatum]
MSQSFTSNVLEPVPFSNEPLSREMQTYCEYISPLNIVFHPPGTMPQSLVFHVLQSIPSTNDSFASRNDAECSSQRILLPGQKPQVDSRRLFVSECNAKNCNERCNKQLSRRAHLSSKDTRTLGLAATSAGSWSFSGTVQDLLEHVTGSEVVSSLEENSSDGEATVKVHDYIGLSQTSAFFYESNIMGSEEQESQRQSNNGELPDLNLGETELRLGPPECTHSSKEPSSESVFHGKDFLCKADLQVSCSEEILVDQLQSSCNAASISSAKVEFTMKDLMNLDYPIRPLTGNQLQLKQPSQETHSGRSEVEGPPPSFSGAKREFSQTVNWFADEESAVAGSTSIGSQADVRLVRLACTDLETKLVRKLSLPPVYPWGEQTVQKLSDDAKPIASNRPSECWGNSHISQPISMVKYETGDDLQALNAHYIELAPASSAPAVLGWPPVRAFRNRTLAAQAPPKRSIESLCPAFITTNPALPRKGQSSSYIKVYMDGILIGRKVDLKNINSYEKLSTELEGMFRRFISGFFKIKKSLPGEDALSEDSKRQIFYLGSGYVLTYEDKDGDLMLVGDVPWRLLFILMRARRIEKVIQLSCLNAACLLGL